MPSTFFSEPELCRLLRSQNRIAFNALHEQYSGALFAEILRIVKLHNVAEDLLQETFVQIYRQFEQYDVSKGRLFTWIITIARNKSIDYLRCASTRYSARTESLTDDGNGSTTDTTTARLENQMLHRRLEQLADGTRELIRLVYIHGHTQQEVAEMHQLPLGTVKTRLRSGIQQLRQLSGFKVAMS